MREIILSSIPFLITIDLIVYLDATASTSSNQLPRSVLL